MILFQKSQKKHMAKLHRTSFPLHQLIRNWNRTLGIQPRVAIQRPYFLYADSTPALIMGAYDGYWYIFGTSRNCLRKYSKLSLSNIEQVLKSFWKGKWKQIKEKHPLIRLRFNFQVCSAAIYCKKISFIGTFTYHFLFKKCFIVKVSSVLLNNLRC